jgi:SAM-dependent methyltransferase
MNDLGNKNIDFYNKIATEYDSLLRDKKSVIVRNFVKNYILQNIKPCAILDFGGGTGIDSEWLIENNFSVTFCEPAEKMRDIAIRKFQSMNEKKISFLDDQKKDFENWTSEDLSFPKADCALANFNVINSIANPEMLFGKLKIALKPGAHFIGTMLNTRLSYRMKMKPFRFINSLFQNQTTQKENFSQTVFRYKPDYIRLVAKPNFSLHRFVSISRTDFLLFDFIADA